MSAKSRPMVLCAVLALLTLPALAVIVDAATFHTANRPNGTFVYSGEARSYLLYVPPSYDRTRATPLVISMHGAAGWPVQQRDVSRWNELADREGFIVVYPSAAEGAGPRIWRVERGPGLATDVGFISTLIDTVEAGYNIDRGRIYANGLSNGGGMSFALSCTLSDRVAAVGLVAAAQTLPFRWCTDRRPVPMIAFHGTADPDIPYSGGTSWMAPDTFPNMLQWTKDWARRNQCVAAPVDAVVASDVTRLEYTACLGGATVVLYTIVGGGHTWPGGGPLPEWWLGRTSRSIDATKLMWDFFRQHRLAR